MSALAFDFGDTLEREPAQQRRLVAVGAAVEAPRVQSLDAMLTGTWSALAAGRVAACPVCSSAVLPRWSAGAGVVGARCDDCGTSID